MVFPARHIELTAQGRRGVRAWNCPGPPQPTHPRPLATRNERFVHSGAPYRLMDGASGRQVPREGAGPASCRIPGPTYRRVESPGRKMDTSKIAAGRDDGAHGAMSRGQLP